MPIPGWWDDAMIEFLTMPENIERKLRKADQLALQARRLAENGDQAGARRLRKRFDKIYTEVSLMFDQQGGCSQMNMFRELAGANNDV